MPGPSFFPTMLTKEELEHWDWLKKLYPDRTEALFVMCKYLHENGTFMYPPRYETRIRVGKFIVTACDDEKIMLMI